MKVDSDCERFGHRHNETLAQLVSSFNYFSAAIFHEFMDGQTAHELWLRQCMVETS
jgi:hypothetical protein